ncbi:MAG: hypothetical protein IPP12_21090 [Nitrospira sp.]|nr:hypothetical protein [Nitrospira sp.]
MGGRWGNRLKEHGIMLNPRLARFRHGDSVRQLHIRYGSLDPSALWIMWQLFLERPYPLEESPLLPMLRTLLPDGKADTSTARQSSWLRTVYPADEVRLPLVAFRNGALYLYIEAAALRVETRTEVEAIRRCLQGLGGSLARVKHSHRRDGERQAITAKIEEGQWELKWLQHWPRLDHTQLWWHWAMVRAYECLPRTGSTQRVSPLHVKQLCQWLSVPEIGLVCTLATIKAARRRFAGRDWLGIQYPTYLATPRQPMQSSGMDSPNESYTSPDEDEDPIRFTCHLCHLLATGTLRQLGLHLQEQHRIQPNRIEVSEAERAIRKKATRAVLSTWQDLTELKGTE